MEKVNVRPNWVRGSCIGKGSFGTVSLAVDKSDGRVFAVKSVEQSSCVLSQVEALESEIRILRSLSSPYVVEYLGDDVTRESPTTSYRNLHVEYLPGGTVAELAKHDVDERDVGSYTWCIVSALRYVHSVGIVHCDVKGRNVLVGPTNGAAKLADFGSSKEVAAAVSPRGSPLWMAPEVIRGEYQGPESDVWSLGCTVIEMATGKPAWDDRGADTLCQIGYSDELPKLPTQLSELGRDFLEKCLRRNPSERWSCDQLLQHPFISSSSPSSTTADGSPRCVLDWFDSNFSDDDQTRDQIENLNSNAEGRICKLASNTGSIWESDGWLVVREGEEGTSWAYRNLIRTEVEMQRTSSEYSDSIGIDEVSERTNWEYLDSKVLEAGWSCRRCGSPQKDWAVEREEKNIYSYCKILFLLNFYLYYYNCYILSIYNMIPFNLDLIYYCM